MKAVTQLLILAFVSVAASAIFGGCRAAHDVAVTSYHVATAPVNFVRRRTNHSEAGGRTVTTTTTTVTRTTKTTAIPDATDPEHPGVTPPPKRPGRLVGTDSSKPPPTAAPHVSHAETTRKKPKATPRAASSAQTEFPTAKVVPDKPGYVFSPFDPKGRYVDVSGYTSGSKVKDPWTDKIFIVP